MFATDMVLVLPAPDGARWTHPDIDRLPDPDDHCVRYELIDGVLYVSSAPHLDHAACLGQALFTLETWNRDAKLGTTLTGVGLVFDAENGVIPDLIWISHERFQRFARSDGKFHGAPELVVEVLSLGADNDRRDRETKRQLYAARGVEEYWVIRWFDRRIEVYRREHENEGLALIELLSVGDTLTSPLLPGFAAEVTHLCPPPTVFTP